AARPRPRGPGRRCRRPRRRGPRARRGPPGDTVGGVIDLVALDMAGTTIDEHGAVYVALQHAVEAEGTPVTEDAVQRWMGTDKREAMIGLTEAGGRPTPTRDDVERMYERFRSLLARAYAAVPP